MQTATLAQGAAREHAWEAVWGSRRADIEGDWRATQAHRGGDDLGSDPDWCLACEQIYPGTLRWIRLLSGDEVEVVPVRLQRSEVRCCLGEVHLLSLRPRQLQLAGEQIRLPASDAAYRALFRSFLQERGEWDVVRLSVPTNSHFWRWLQAGEPERFGLHRYEPQPPRPHDLIELPPSFADYTAKFNPKTRKNREREIRHLEQKGRVRLQCYRTPADIEPFLAAAGAISRRSYQHKLLNVGLREPARLRPRLETAAEHGWWRSYVLWCGQGACSYMLGYQYRGRYHYASIGYDPEWAKWDVGTVLHWLVLQDMFRTDPPAIFDFGSRGPQKQYFGNHQFEEATLYYLRSGLYRWLFCSCHGGSLRLSRATGRWLGQHQLKPRAQRFIRRLRGC